MTDCPEYLLSTKLMVVVFRSVALTKLKKRKFKKKLDITKEDSDLTLSVYNCHESQYFILLMVTDVMLLAMHMYHIIVLQLNTD